MKEFLSLYRFLPDYEGFLGLEREIWTIDSKTGKLIIVAPAIFSKYPEGKIKPELPAHQLEIITDPCPTVEALLEDLNDSLLFLDHLLKYKVP